jgi:hypothetical protein
MRWRNWLMGAASLLVLACGTTSARGWFYNYCDCYYYYGACPDWYWSRGLLYPWSLCPGGCCNGGACGWGCWPNYSFCPNPPYNYLTSETEVDLGGYQAVSYVRVLGGRVGFMSAFPAEPTSRSR